MSRTAANLRSPLAARRFARRVVLLVLPTAFVWALLTPFYNRFLSKSAETLVRLAERPPVTRLAPYGRHHLLISRTDTTRARIGLPSIRTTDTHFPLLLLIPLFLAVPGLPERRRFENLGWALLASVFFHILSLSLRVEFIYATQLGAWSAEHYPPWARELWGISSHSVEIVGKLAFPFLLWAAFYLRLFLGERPRASCRRGSSRSSSSPPPGIDS